MGSTWNLPDGVSTDQLEEPMQCIDCDHFTVGLDGRGVCLRELRDWLDCEPPTAREQTAELAAEWTLNHLQSETAEACGRFEC